MTIRLRVPSQASHRGAGGGDDGSEAHAGGTGAGGRICEVVDIDHRDDVRLDRPQNRQLSRGEGDVGGLDEGVAELLGTGAQIPLRSVGLDEGLEHRLDLLPADRIELPAERQPPVQQLRQRQ
jgi:hypothetical protein